MRQEPFTAPPKAVVVPISELCSRCAIIPRQCFTASPVDRTDPFLLEDWSGARMATFTGLPTQAGLLAGEPCSTSVLNYEFCAARLCLRGAIVLAATTGAEALQRARQGGWEISSSECNRLWLLKNSFPRNSRK